MTTSDADFERALATVLADIRRENGPGMYADDFVVQRFDRQSTG